MTPILLLKELVTSAGPRVQGYLKEKFSKLFLQVQEFMKILKKFNILKSIYSRYQGPTLWVPNFRKRLARAVIQPSL